MRLWGVIVVAVVFSISVYVAVAMVGLAMIEVVMVCECCRYCDV